MTELQHRLTGNVLLDVTTRLKMVLALLRQHYPSTHDSHRQGSAALDSLQGLRITMENEGRREHPGAGVVYPVVPPPSAGLQHAVAECGDGVGSD